MGTMEALLREHTEQEDKRFEKIIDDIDKIKNNHLHHIQNDISEIQITIAGIKTDLSWVKWGIILVLGALVTGSLALIFKI